MLFSFFILLTSCSYKIDLNNVESNNISSASKNDETIYDNKINKNIEQVPINVKFKLGNNKEYNNVVVEDNEKLKSEKKEHSIKYYSYIPLEKKRVKILYTMM